MPRGSPRAAALRLSTSVGRRPGALTRLRAIVPEAARERTAVAYTVGVWLLGGTLVFSIFRTAGSELPSPWALILALVAIPAGEPQMRFRKPGGEDHSFTLEEAILPSLLLLGPLAWVPPLMAAGVLGMLLRCRLGTIKTIYNTGVELLASAVAVTIARALVGASIDASAASIGVVLLALFVHGVVTVVALTGLFFALDRREPGQMVRRMSAGNAAIPAATITAGLLLALAVEAQPPVAVLAVAVVFLIRAGLKHHTEALVAHAQALRLQHVTTAFSELGALEGSDLDSALGAIGEAFGADVVQFAHGPVDSAGTRLSHARSGRSVPLSPQLEEVRLKGHEVVVRDHEREPAEARALGFRDGLIVPFVADGMPGAVGVFDREGMAPGWGPRELHLLRALVEHLAVAISNQTLFRAVETERAALAVESAKLRDILDAAGDGIALLDTGGRVVTWNRAFEGLTGVTSSAAAGHRWPDLLELRDSAGAALPEGPPQLAAATAHGVIARDVDVQVRCPDGWRWAHCSFAPVLSGDGRVLGVVIVARDVSQQREVEQLRADFLAVVSHELRTPLTPLRGFLQLLLDRDEELDRETKFAVHDSMMRQVRRLEALVSDVLVMAELGSGELPLDQHPVDLAIVAEAASAAELRPTHGNRLKVVAEGHPMVRTDGAACLRILRAIVSNALTHGRGEVIVRVRSDGPLATVEVSDEGPGIESWQRDAIFEAFRRVGSHLEWGTQGPGLGLAIARGLAERLGGSLDLESEVGVGSTFRLRLPAATAHDHDVDLETADLAVDAVGD